jgi:hypothetical protein
VSITSVEGVALESRGARRHTVQITANIWRLRSPEGDRRIARPFGSPEEAMAFRDAHPRYATWRIGLGEAFTGSFTFEVPRP